MPEPLAGRLALTGSAGQLPSLVALTGTKFLADAHARTLPQPIPANRAPNP